MSQFLYKSFIQAPTSPPWSPPLSTSWSQPSSVAPHSSVTHSSVVPQNAYIGRGPINRRPISSYGIIAHTLYKSEIKYLLGMRRDTISYCEFLKNNLPIDIIPMHMNLMSKEEKHRILNHTFDDLWDDLWINHKSKLYRSEHKRCKDAFPDNVEKYRVMLEDDDIGSNENPWGFPKGRKHISESELNCALREFEEETNISHHDVKFDDQDPYEEQYTGSDGKSYRTVFYLACIKYTPNFELQSCRSNIRKYCISEEISDLRWFSYDEAMAKISEEKQSSLRGERHRILRSVNTFLSFNYYKRKRPGRRYSF